MSTAQKKAAARYRAKQVQIQALINPDTERDLAEAWDYLRRQFPGSSKKAIAWAISRSKQSMDTFRVWRDDGAREELTIKAVNMTAALDEAAYQFGYVDYADMAQGLDWTGDQGLNIIQLEIEE